MEIGSKSSFLHPARFVRLLLRFLFENRENPKNDPDKLLLTINVACLRYLCDCFDAITIEAHIAAGRDVEEYSRLQIAGFRKQRADRGDEDFVSVKDLLPLAFLIGRTRMVCIEPVPGTPSTSRRILPEQLCDLGMFRSLDNLTLRGVNPEMVFIDKFRGRNATRPGAENLRAQLEVLSIVNSRISSLRSVLLHFSFLSGRRLSFGLEQKTKSGRDCPAVLHTLRLQNVGLARFDLALLTALPQLKTLDLSHNSLSTAVHSGEWFGDIDENKENHERNEKLTSIQSIDLGYNRFASVDGWLTYFPSLKRLDLRGNRVASLYGLLGNLNGEDPVDNPLSNLSRLDLRDNLLCCVEELSVLSKLPQMIQTGKIWLAGNPLTFLKSPSYREHALLTIGSTTIELDGLHLSKREKAIVENNNEMKRKKEKKKNLWAKAKKENNANTSKDVPTMGTNSFSIKTPQQKEKSTKVSKVQISSHSVSVRNGRKGKSRTSKLRTNRRIVKSAGHRRPRTMRIRVASIDPGTESEKDGRNSSSAETTPHVKNRKNGEKFEKSTPLSMDWKKVRRERQKFNEKITEWQKRSQSKREKNGVQWLSYLNDENTDSDADISKNIQKADAAWLANGVDQDEFESLSARRNRRTSFSSPGRLLVHRSNDENDDNSDSDNDVAEKNDTTRRKLDFVKDDSSDLHGDLEKKDTTAMENTIHLKVNECNDDDDDKMSIDSFASAQSDATPPDTPINAKIGKGEECNEREEALEMIDRTCDVVAAVRIRMERVGTGPLPQWKYRVLVRVKREHGVTTFSHIDLDDGQQTFTFSCTGFDPVLHVIDPIPQPAPPSPFSENRCLLLSIESSEIPSGVPRQVEYVLQTEEDHNELETFLRRAFSSEDTITENRKNDVNEKDIKVEDNEASILIAEYAAPSLDNDESSSSNKLLLSDGALTHVKSLLQLRRGGANERKGRLHVSVLQSFACGFILRRKGYRLQKEEENGNNDDDDDDSYFKYAPPQIAGAVVVIDDNCILVVKEKMKRSARCISEDSFRSDDKMISVLANESVECLRSIVLGFSSQWLRLEFENDAESTSIVLLSHDQRTTFDIIAKLQSSSVYDDSFVEIQNDDARFLSFLRKKMFVDEPLSSRVKIYMLLQDFGEVAASPKKKRGKIQVHSLRLLSLVVTNASIYLLREDYGSSPPRLSIVECGGGIGYCPLERFTKIEILEEFGELCFRLSFRRKTAGFIRAKKEWILKAFSSHGLENLTKELQRLKSSK
eukprot:g2968.t1